MDTPSGIFVTVQELLQYQQTMKCLLQPTRIAAQQSGAYLSPIRGRGMDFAEVRNYQSGDDIRHMDWRVTARTGTPHIKLYHEERERPVFIVVDFNPSMFFATRNAYKSVVAARFAALLGFTASTHGDRVGGVLFSGTDIKDLRPRARKAGILPLLQQLSEFSQQPSMTTRLLSEALTQVRRVTKPGSLVFILSDFETMDEDAQAHLKRLSNTHDVFAYLLSDPLERQAPPPGYYSITDGQQASVLNTYDANVTRKYNQHYLTKQRRLQALLKPGHVIEVSTDEDLARPWQLTFSTYQRQA